MEDAIYPPLRAVIERVVRSFGARVDYHTMMFRRGAFGGGDGSANVPPGVGTGPDVPGAGEDPIGDETLQELDIEWKSNGRSIWYDPRDLSLMWQDVEGTIPVTGPGQPVGLIADKSGYGNHGYQLEASRRPIYQVDEDGVGYLAFNGVDTYLRTERIDFGYVNAFAIYAGWAIEEDLPGAQTIAEVSPDAETQRGTVGLFCDDGPIFTASGRSANTLNTASPAVNLLEKYSVTVLMSVTNDYNVMRINGTEVARTEGDFGNTVQRETPVYIGHRDSGDTRHAKGRLYGFLLQNYVPASEGEIARPEGVLSERMQTAAPPAPVPGPQPETEVETVPPATGVTNASLQMIFQPHDKSTLFQDAQGTIPVTDVGQPVGLMLDLSGDEHHAYQWIASSRPTYQEDANGTGYIKFDGVDDYLETDLVTAQAATSASVMVAAQAESLIAPTGQLFRYGAPGTDGSFGVYLQGQTGYGRAQGSTEAIASGSLASLFSEPQILTLELNIPEDVTRLMLNETVIETDTGDLGTAALGDQKFYIGLDGSEGSNAYRGRLYALEAVSAQPTAGQSTAGRTEIGESTGVGTYEPLPGGGNPIRNEAPLPAPGDVGTEPGEIGSPDQQEAGDVFVEPTPVEGEEVIPIGGFWYDPSDMASLFQDVEGTMPVTAYGQRVGLMLDKSGNGNHLYQRIYTRRPIYQKDDLGRPNLRFTTSGRYYMRSEEMDLTLYNFLNVQVGWSRLTAGEETNEAIVELSTNVASTEGALRIFHNATEGLGVIGKGSLSAIADGGILPLGDVALIDATVDLSGDRVSLGVDGTLVAEATDDLGTASFGTHALFLGHRDSTDSQHVNARFYGMIATSDREQTTEQTDAKNRFMEKVVKVPVYGPAIGDVPVGEANQQEMSPLFLAGETGAWYDPSDMSTMYRNIEGTLRVTQHGHPVALILDKSGNGNHAYQPDLDKRPTFRDSITDGRSLYFDGVDDFLMTDNANFRITDAVTVQVAFEKSVNGNPTQSILSLRKSAQTSDGSFELFHHNLNGVSFASRGTQNAVIAAGAQQANGSYLVNTAQADISLASLVMRENAVEVATATTAQGSGNYGFDNLYIGQSDLHENLQGAIYGIVIRGIVSGAADVQLAEDYLGSLSDPSAAPITGFADVSGTSGVEPTPYEGPEMGTMLFSAGEEGFWYDLTDTSTLFQDAAQAVPVTAAGDPVGYIVDKSGNGHDLVFNSTTSKRPIYQIDEGGKGYLKFDGTNDSLQSVTPVDWAGDQQGTFAMAAIPYTTGYSSVYLEFGPHVGQTAGTWRWGYLANDSMISQINPAGSATFFNFSETAGLKAVTLTEMDLSTGDITLRLNGAEATTGTVPTGTFTAQTLYAGGRTESTAFGQFDWYGGIAVNRALSTAERDAVESYLTDLAGAGTDHTYNGAHRSSWFQNDEKGVWYDFADLNSMYQDVNGQAPVTEAGQRVALVLDKSGNNKHLFQFAEGLRPYAAVDQEGKPCLHFTAVGQYLETQETLDLTTDQHITIAAAIKPLGALNTNHQLLSAGDPNSGAGAYRIHRAGGGYGAVFRGTEKVVANILPYDWSDLVPHVALGRCQLEVAEAEFRIDGVQEMYGTGPADAGTFGEHTVRVCGPTASDGGMVCYHYGGIVGNFLATNAEMVAAEEYLATRASATLAS